MLLYTFSVCFFLNALQLSLQMENAHSSLQMNEVLAQAERKRCLAGDCSADSVMQRCSLCSAAGAVCVHFFGYIDIPALNTQFAFFFLTSYRFVLTVHINVNK